MVEIAKKRWKVRIIGDQETKRVGSRVEERRLWIMCRELIKYLLRSPKTSPKHKAEEKRKTASGMDTQTRGNG